MLYSARVAHTSCDNSVNKKAQLNLTTWLREIRSRDVKGAASSPVVARLAVTLRKR